MKHSTLQLSREGLRHWRKGHPWIFRRAFERAEGVSGDVVTVVDAQDHLIGKGFYSEASQIAVRLLTFHDDIIDETFFRKRLDDAMEFRKRIAATANAYRVIFSESDRLPGVILDRYNDHLVLQTLTPGAESLKPFLVEELQKRFSPEAIVLRNDVSSRKLEGLPAEKSVLWGSSKDKVAILEGDVRLEVDLMEGQKTGAFLDQRENHLEIKKYCAGGRMLDLFTYQGGFALQVARVAKEVIALDASEKALAIAEENARRNEFTNISFEKGKAFDALRELGNRGLFDCVVVDPPPFAKSAREIEGAERGYRDLNLRALKVLREGGYLLTCTCSYHMTEERFLRVLQQAAASAGRNVRVIEKRTQASDHPMLLTMPETFYLKCLVLQVF